MDKRRQFCKDFEAQDTELAQQVLNATEGVKLAQEGLDASKKEAKEIIEVESDGRSDMAVEVSDEGQQRPDAQRGHDGHASESRISEKQSRPDGPGKCQQAASHSSRRTRGFAAIFAAGFCAARSIDRREIGSASMCAQMDTSCRP